MWHRGKRNNPRRWLLVALLALPVVQAEFAEAGQSSPPDYKWDITIQGGAVTTSNSPDGVGTLPSPNPPAAGLNGGRQVPSWYFGDGAVVLNQNVLARLGSQLTPLDPALMQRFVERGTGGSVGVRIGRSFTPRLGAEFSVDYNSGSLALTDEALSTIEAARASFVPAMNVMLTGLVFASRSVTSVPGVSERKGGQITTTGSLLIHLKTDGRLLPYVAVGAGVVSNVGSTPSATLTGQYDFTLNVFGGSPGPPPSLRQIDVVTVRSSMKNSPAWVIGGGFKYSFTSRWGVRVDVRDHIASSTIETLVDTSPSSTPLTSFGTLVTFSSQAPPVTFSSLASMSTLGNPLSGFKTFDGSGLEHHVNVLAGLFFRF